MNILEYRQLRNEKNKIEHALSQFSSSATDALKSSIERRHKEVLRLLEEFDDLLPSSDIGVLAIDGPSISDRHSIPVGFAGELLRLLGSTLASLSGRKAEPILTGLVHGSFGFQIEPGEAQQTFMGGVTPTALAFQRLIHALNGANAEDDEEVARAFYDFNASAMSGFKRFVATLADNGAICSVEMGGDSFRFQDISQVRELAARVESKVVESDEKWEGIFQGFLPDHLQGEFLQTGGSESVVVRLDVDQGEGPENWNELVGRMLEISVRRRRVGNSRPHFSVVSILAVEKQGAST